MIALKILVLSILVLGITCRSTFTEESGYETPEYEEIPSKLSFETLHPTYMRVRRQVNTNVKRNLDGTANIFANLPLASNNLNKLKAIAAITGLNNVGKYGSIKGGLELENDNGHSLTATAQHVPGFGDKLTGAVDVALLNTGNHKLDANAFITKNIPSNPNVPSFITKGGSLDYLFKNKVGASLGMTQNDFLHSKDLSAMGNLNIFRNPSSSLDLKAGFTRTISPFISNSRWQPNIGLTFSNKFW